MQVKDVESSSFSFQTKGFLTFKLLVGAFVLLFNFFRFISSTCTRVQFYESFSSYDISDTYYCDAPGSRETIILNVFGSLADCPAPPTDIDVLSKLVLYAVSAQISSVFGQTHTHTHTRVQTTGILQSGNRKHYLNYQSLKSVLIMDGASIFLTTK